MKKKNKEVTVKVGVNKMNKICELSYAKGIETVQKEVEELRVELTETKDRLSQICERLWEISHKKHPETKRRGD